MAPFMRSILIISICLCTLVEAHAEEQQRPRTLFRVGGMVGGGLVDWVGEDANEGLPGTKLVSRAGFSAGLMGALDVSDLLSLGVDPLHLSLQAELLYVTRGATLEIDEEYRATINMDYLQVGLILRAAYFRTGKITPYLLLGPELGSLLRAKTTNRFGMTSDIKDNFTSTDLGLVLGVGAMYELPRYGALGLELRGDLGLVSIDGQGDGDEIRNAALTLLLAYLY